MSRNVLRRRRQGSTAGRVLVPIVIIVTLAYLVPIYWMFVGAFAPSSTFLSLGDLVPKAFTFENFELILGRYPAARWFLNSLIVASIGTFLVVTTSALAGYVFGKKRFPGRDALFWLIIGTLAMPAAVRLIPLFLTMRDLGWINSYPGLIAPYVASAFGVFLVKQFMQSIPNELIDAARVDGASELRTLVQIILPLARPALGALAIFTFMGLWNDYVWPLVLATDTQMTTLTVGVATISTAVQSTNYGTVFAGAVISFVPMLVIFVLFQGYFVRGISAGALKG